MELEKGSSTITKETACDLRWRNGVLQQRFWIETKIYGQRLDQVSGREEWRDVPSVTE